MTETTIILEVTQEELALIRSSLCDKSMKALSKALDIKHECQEKGYHDDTSWIYMDTRNKINNIIEKIDKAS